MPDTPFPPTQMGPSGPPQQMSLPPSVEGQQFPMYPYGSGGQPGLPPFPTWPPPNGGAPFPTGELGPITNPYPYGSTQTGNISIANPAPPFNAIRYPQLMPVGANGQNQGGIYQLPKMTKNWEVGPILAGNTSQIQPPPIMGPGPQGTSPY